MEWNFKRANFKEANKKMEFSHIFPQFPGGNFFSSPGGLQNLSRMTNLSGDVMNFFESLHQSPPSGIFVMAASFEGCLANFPPVPLPTKPKMSYADVAKIIPEVLRPKPEQKIPLPPPKKKMQENHRPRHSYHKPLRPQGRSRPQRKPTSPCDKLDKAKQDLTRPSCLKAQCPKIATEPDCKKSLPRNESAESVVLIPLKVRTLSDCSLDSDDSFIVFESNDDEEPIEDVISDDESSSEDEVDFCVPSEAELNLPPSPCIEANKRWNSSYGATSDKLAERNTTKKVSFANDKDLAKVQTIVVWDFASRSARKGPWEQMARDSARFRERILRTENILGPILEHGHRQKIFSQRFMSD